MKIQTDFSAIGPTIFELWVMEIELWVMKTKNPNSALAIERNRLQMVKLALLYDHPSNISLFFVHVYICVYMCIYIYIYIYIIL